MKIIFATLSVLWSLCFSFDVLAADSCKAIALRDVPALEDPSSILRRGEYDTGITQYRVSKQTGLASLCSHGGYCYPTHVFVDGIKVKVLRLTNCKVGKKDYENSEEYFYDVDVIRSAVNAVDLRRDDVDNKLVGMGLCSACAANAAQHYVHRPRSKCGRLVKAALEGSSAALKRLKRDRGYCS